MKKFISVLLICFLFITPALADSYSELIEKAVTYTANGDTQKAMSYAKKSFTPQTPSM